MSQPIIEVRGISKRYQLGAIGATRLRDDVERVWDQITGRAPKADEKEFWALRDVSFEVQPGEIVGIIGRNGAGKSTLLKILSRITNPSGGEVVMRGRVASLLEVGTGFHGDLTGRENIYLNGAILGMTKGEIRSKLDEIIAFAEIEKFIDTPVKRYSSGMYVRLAFAVAAHLEPEILIVDEVLAVGDQQFQQKCIGKMQSVSQNGRTVLFVSHSMDTVLKLCTKGIILSQGRTEFCGSSREAMQQYFSGARQQIVVHQLESLPRLASLRLGARFTSICVLDADHAPCFQLPFGESPTFRVILRCSARLSHVKIGIGFHQVGGVEAASSRTVEINDEHDLMPGDYELTIRLPYLFPLPNHYHLGLSLTSTRGLEDYVSDVGRLEVVASPTSSELEAETFRGLIYTPTKHDLRALVETATH